MEKIRVLIADDHAVLRLGLRILINGQPDMELCDEASNGAEAIEMYRRSIPDIVLIDVRMPLTGGIQAIRALRAQFPDARILVFSSYANEEEIFQAIRSGAQGYLLKDVGREEILAGIRAVHENRVYLPPMIAGRLANRNPEMHLTSREIEVLRLVVKGMMNKEIALLLTLSENTVKTHVKNIFTKLEVSDRAEAVSFALQRGILPLEG